MQAAAAGRDLVGQARESAERRRTRQRSHRASCSYISSRHVRPKNKAKTIAETERRFNKYILPRWGERSVQEIRRRDVIGLLDAIVDQGAPVSANRVLLSSRHSSPSRSIGLSSNSHRHTAYERQLQRLAAIES